MSPGCNPGNVGRQRLLRSEGAPHETPLQGWNVRRNRFPRVAPWAPMNRTVGAKNIHTVFSWTTRAIGLSYKGLEPCQGSP